MLLHNTRLKERGCQRRRPTSHPPSELKQPNLRGVHISQSSHSPSLYTPVKTIILHRTCAVAVNNTESAGGEVVILFALSLNRSLSLPLLRNTAWPQWLCSSNGSNVQVLRKWTETGLSTTTLRWGLSLRRIPRGLMFSAVAALPPAGFSLWSLHHGGWLNLNDPRSESETKKQQSRAATFAAEGWHFTEIKD